jgi:RecB family exonuclease
MTKAEIISALSAKGIETLYGQTLSALKKKELETAWEAIQKGAPTHLSHTQVSMYRRCSMQYYWRYIRNLTRPPGAAQTLGLSVDTAENHNYSQKIETFTDEPLDVIEDVYHEDFEARKDETDWQDNDPSEVHSKGRGLIKVYRDRLAPVTIPVAVQKEYNVSFGNTPFTFKAFVDLIAWQNEGPDWEGEYIIIDNKTSAKTPAQSQIDRGSQLTAYAGVYRMLNGQPDGFTPVGIDALVSTKEPKAVQLRSTRCEVDIQRYFKTVQAVYENICTGAFVPVEADNWVCDPKWCGYFGICHEEF